MTGTPSPDPAAALAVVPRALVGSSLALLVLGAVLNGTGRAADGPEAVSWVATAWAIAAPLVAVFLRGQGLAPPPPGTGGPDEPVSARLRRTLVFFAVLESGVVLAAVALLVSRPQWPLLAAMLPLATMILNLPRGAAR